MTIQQLRSDRRIHVPATAITIALTMLLPVLVHLVGGPAAGGRLIPLFYAPAAAAIVFHPGVAVVAGAVTPLLNHLLTGSPPLPLPLLLSFELVIFALIMQAAHRRRPGWWWIAPLAYLLAKLVELVVLAVLPVDLLPVSPWQHVSTTALNAWPGLLVLLLINWLAVRGVDRDG